MSASEQIAQRIRAAPQVWAEEVHTAALRRLGQRGELCPLYGFGEISVLRSWTAVEAGRPVLYLIYQHPYRGFTTGTRRYLDHTGAAPLNQLGEVQDPVEELAAHIASHDVEGSWQIDSMIPDEDDVWWSGHHPLPAREHLRAHTRARTPPPDPPTFPPSATGLAPVLDREEPPEQPPTGPEWWGKWVQISESLSKEEHAGIEEDGAGDPVLLVPRDCDPVAVLGKAQAALSSPLTSLTVRQVPLSLATLERMRDFYVWAQIGDALSGHLLSAQIDDLHNRVIIGVDEVTDEIRGAAATRFGNAVALRKEQMRRLF